MALESGISLAHRMLSASVALGAGAVADGVRAGAALVMNLPGVGPALRQGVSSILDDIDLTALIRDRIDLDVLVESIDIEVLVARLDVATVVDKLDLDAVVEQLVIDSVVQRLDVAAVVDRLDVDAVVGRLDMDALVERLDVDSIVRRIDMMNVLSGMVERMKLPTAIRDSLRTSPGGR